ncbi:MAG: hypothetical protein J0M11_19415 [Anaerolineae bacterium]|nr:hypothetical protein [Anaerolineae bacterium]
MNRKLPNILIIIVFLVVGFILFIDSKFKNENPKIEWDKSSDVLVISYERRYDVDYNYIPAFRIWGDGYIVWVNYESDGSRKVFDGYLPQSDLMLLLEKFRETNFFTHCNEHQNYAFDYIRISLLNKSCSNLIDENGFTNLSYADIAGLVDFLASGAGVEGREYIPTIGYLYAVPYEKTEYFQNQTTIHPEIIWPADEFGYEIADVLEKEIVGAELFFAWKIVNSPEPFVISDGKAYWISVIIPKISQ